MSHIPLLTRGHQVWHAPRSAAEQPPKRSVKAMRYLCIKHISLRHCPNAIHAVRAATLQTTPCKHKHKPAPICDIENSRLVNNRLAAT